jgi:hypothetical protein
MLMEMLLAASIPKFVIIKWLLYSDLVYQNQQEVLGLVCDIECPSDASINLMGNCFVIDKFRWLRMTVIISENKYNSEPKGDV